VAGADCGGLLLGGNCSQARAARVFSAAFRILCCFYYGKRLLGKIFKP
jgi:hypothetical protein